MFGKMREAVVPALCWTTRALGSQSVHLLFLKVLSPLGLVLGVQISLTGDPGQE